MRLKITLEIMELKPFKHPLSVVNNHNHFKRFQALAVNKVHSLRWLEPLKLTILRDMLIRVIIPQDMEIVIHTEVVKDQDIQL
jgi:hypothetical protein